MANNGGGGGENEQTMVAVAINKDRGSKHVVKWALDSIVSRGQSLYLVHVKPPFSDPSLATSSSSSSRPALQNHEVDTQRQQYYASIAELYISFRCFCLRRQVKCEIIELEDTNVGRALIDFVHQYAVQTLLIGASSRNGLARLFKAGDIASSVLRGAPGFCNVYVVSKGKLSSSRTAFRPPPNVSASERDALANRNLNANAALPLPAGGDTDDKTYDEFLEQDLDASFESPGRPSTDSMLSFYDNLGSEIMRQSSRIGKESLVNSLEDHEWTSWSSQNPEEMKEKFKNLTVEFGQTKEMFQEALNEASAAIQKAMELEQRLKDAKLGEQAALDALEKERKQYREAIELNKEAQRIAKHELEKREYAEKMVLKEAEEKKKVLDALHDSKSILKYQTIFNAFFLIICIFLLTLSKH